MPLDNWMVSPKYDMNSLRDGHVRPIDVFQDAMQGWVLDYAWRLVELKEHNAGMALMLLIVAYPETIECYSTGTDSVGRSKRYFTGGMKRIFPELGELITEDALGTICDDLRNGLYHASMLKGTVVLDPNGKAVMYSPEDQQFVVNPFEFLRRVQEHFMDYVARLRAAGADDTELMNFNQFWALRHGPTELLAKAEAYPVPHEEIVTSTAAPIDPSRWTRNM